MITEDLYNTIRTRFQTQVVDVLGNLPTQYDNAPFTKPQDSRWIRFTIQPENSRQVDAGASTKRFRTFGVALASIYTPINQGDQDALSIADTIGNAFRGLNDGLVTFQTPTVLNVGRTEDEWQVDVSCPFYIDNLL